MKPDDKHKAFDHELSERFRGFEVKPPARVWEAVDMSLSATAASRSGRLLPRVLRIAATLALLIVSEGIWRQWDNHSPGDTGFQTETARDQAIAAEELLSGSEDSSGVILLAERPLPEPEQRTLTALAGDLFSDGLKIGSAALAAPPSLIHTERKESARLVLATLSCEPLNKRGSAPVSPVKLTGTGLLSEEYPAFTRPEPASRHLASLAVYLAPAYNNRRLGGTADAFFADIPFARLEHQAYSMSMALQAGFRLGARWQIHTGLAWQNAAYAITDILAYAHPDRQALYASGPGAGRFSHPQTVITSLGGIRFHDPALYFADAASHRVLTNRQGFSFDEPRMLNMLDQSLTQRFGFAELPLIIQYSLFNQRLGLDIKGGMSVAWLIRNEVYLGADFMQHAIGETYGLRNLHMSAQAGLVLSVPLSAHFQLRLEPTAQMFLRPLVRSELPGSQASLYRYYINSGLVYKF